MIEKFFEHIRKEEGFREKAYWDIKHWSIGYGTSSFEGEVISLREAERRMKLKAEHIWTADFYRLPIKNHNEIGTFRKLALCSMIYQMGLRGVGTFKKMLKAIDDKDWAEAKKEALDSNWAKQTPARAEIVANIIKDGVL